MLDIRSQRTMIPERHNINKVSPTIAPDYYLKKISRPWYREGNSGQIPVG